MNKDDLETTDYKILKENNSELNFKAPSYKYNFLKKYNYKKSNKIEKKKNFNYWVNGLVGKNLVKDARSKKYIFIKPSKKILDLKF